MASTPALFYRGSAATISSTLYTASSKAVLTDIIVSNTSTGTEYVTMTIDGVNIIPTVSIPGNTVISLQPKTIIESTKILAGYASSTNVKFHISGVEL